MKKTENMSKPKIEHKLSEDEYQEYLRFKSDSTTHSSTPSVSLACISQSMDSQSLWIIDSGAFDHIFGNNSLFICLL